MLVNFSAIKDLAVVNLDQQTKNGTINDLVINPSDGKILCFLIKTGFFSSPKVLLFQDILNWGEDFVLIQNEQALMNPEEVVRVHQMMEKRAKLIDQKVVNPQKQRIGKITDFTLDLDIGQINRITVEVTPLKGVFETERLVPWNRILKITPQFVMIEEWEKNKKSLKELADEII